MNNPSHTDSRVLRVNVGFLLREGAGYSRDVEFEVPGKIRADDIDLFDLEGRVHLTRTPQGVLAQGSLSADIPSECTRCLTSFPLTISIEFEELFALYTTEQSSTGVTYMISEGGDIDLTPLIREEALLGETSIQVLCKSDCKGLCPQCGQNLNEDTCSCEAEQIDPRLAILKDLLDSD